MKSHATAGATLLSLVLSATFSAGGSKNADAGKQDGWQWSISGGPSWNYMGRLGFNGGSRSQNLTLPSLVSGASLVVPPVGDEQAVGDRLYLDGYVRQDAGTEVDGSTWYWGYDQPSQVVGDSLVYHATGYESVRSDSISSAAGRRSSDSLLGSGISLRADVTTPWSLGPFRVGGMLGLAAASDSQSYRFGNFNAVQTSENFRHDYRDTYDLDGVVPPAAPYSGGPGGPGPLIWNIPNSRSITTTLASTDTAVFANDVHARFENQMLSLALGGSLAYAEGPWTLTAASGLALEFHHYDARQTETLTATTATGKRTVANWSDHSSGTKIRPGVFAELAARRALDDRLFIEGFLRGEVAETFSVSAGPSVFDFEPYGFSMGVRVGLHF